MFWAAIKSGEFPQPDAYIGPRSPVWSDENILKWQLARMEAHKEPAKTPRRRRRATPEEKSAQAA
jgi:hypothetical protein